jgi:ABC-type nitrate/sulfonate/bicarbonate transport system permease component
MIPKHGIKMKDKLSLRKWVLRITSVFCFLVAWQIIGGRVNPVFLSTPSKISIAMVRMILSGELPEALLISMEVIAAGFV